MFWKRKHDEDVCAACGLPFDETDRDTKKRGQRPFCSDVCERLRGADESGACNDGLAT